MGRITDWLMGTRAAERRAVRDQLALQEEVAVEEATAELDKLRVKRAALQSVVDELTERRRGRNA